MQTRLLNTGMLNSAALLALCGSIGCVYETRHARAYSPPPPPVYTQTTLELQDDYVYYPAYEVYYSDRRHQYTYREGHSWVTRSTPPHVSAKVLYEAPFVRLDFHDSPSAHHTAVVQQYPRHWAASGQNHADHEGHDEGRR
jgi:hypothetical protein